MAYAADDESTRCMEIDHQSSVQTPSHDMLRHQAGSRIGAYMVVLVLS